MVTIRCPHCGSPVMVRGRWWECGYCGDCGKISSLHPSEKAKLMQAAAPVVQATVTVTDSSEEETPRRFSRAELEDMVRRWDFDENEWACRDLLIAAFPQAASRWSQEELAEMHTMDLLVETGRRDPQTALEMAKLLLNTAESHLQNEEAASQLFQSAYVDRPQEAILNACGHLGEKDLQRKLLNLLERNPFPHDEIELETGEE